MTQQQPQPGNSTPLSSNMHPTQSCVQVCSPQVLQPTCSRRSLTQLLVYRHSMEVATALHSAASWAATAATRARSAAARSFCARRIQHMRQQHRQHRVGAGPGRSSAHADL
jgi:hypothetical protein